MIRCEWAETGPALMQAYHDTEWGMPLQGGDDLWFEFLCLEGAQAGLSWRTVLEKRARYRALFHGFAIERVAAMDDAALERALRDPGIIRNRSKVLAMRDNARAALRLQHAHGGLAPFLWSFVHDQPIVNHWEHAGQVPASTAISADLSRALKSQGFRFVGPTICYAFMQATGMVNDHLTRCFRHTACAEAARHRIPAAGDQPAGDYSPVHARLPGST